MAPMAAVSSCSLSVAAGTSATLHSSRQLRTQLPVPPPRRSAPRRPRVGARADGKKVGAFCGGVSDVSASQLGLEPRAVEGAAGEDRARGEGEEAGVTRRSLFATLPVFAAAAGGALGVLLGAAGDAHAFSFGFSGPKAWLKAQKRRSMLFLLNPIALAASRLAAAQGLLEAGSSDLATVQGMVREASLDCLSPGFSAGLELCTFKLILKNAASLLDANDPAKQAGDQALTQLLWSFSELHLQLEEAQTPQAAVSRDVILAGFIQVEQSLDNFERTMRVIFDEPAS